MTPHDPSSPSLETLVDHAEAIRRLCRGVLDPALSGDDVAQETFLRAWRNDGEPRRAHLSWWRVLAQNFARDARRGHARRVRREELVARAEAEPSSADIVARADAHRRLVERVLALDEPYRRVVLLRFFDDLDVPAIARATAQSEGAVRTQLHRALNKLRERLEREPGFRSDAALLLGIPLSSGAGIPLTGGVIAMGTAAKCAVGLAALASAILWIAWPSAEHSAPRLEVSTLADAMQRPSKEDAESIVRSAAAETAPSMPAAAVDVQNLGRLVHGKLVSPRGESIWSKIRGQVTLEDARGERITCNVDDRGSFALFDLELGHYAVEASAQGHRSTRTTLDLAAEPLVRRLDLDLEAACVVAVCVLDANGEPLSRPSLYRSGHASVELGFAVSREPFPEHLPVIEWMRYGGNDTGEFREEAPPLGGVGWLDIRAPFPVHVAMLGSNAVLEAMRLDAAPEKLVFRVDPAKVDASRATLRARLVAAGSGLGLESVPWVIGHRQGSRSSTSKLSNGGLVLTDLAPGIVSFEIHAKGFEVFATTIELEPGRDRDLGTIELGPAQSVHGRVRDDRGKVREAKIRLLAGEGTGVDLVRSQGGLHFHTIGGGFGLPGLGARRYAALVRIEGYGSAVFDLDLRNGPAPELEWTVPEGRELSIRVEESEGVRWSLYALGDRGVPLEQADGIGTCVRTLRLALGSHRLILESEGKASRTCDVSVLDDENPLVRFR